MSVVNYTAEQVKNLLELYLNGTTVEDLAKHFEKTERSIVAKLVQEKVYVPTKGATKEKRKTKLEYLAEVETKLGLDAGALESFEKGTLEAVKALHAVIDKYIDLGAYT